MYKELLNTNVIIKSNTKAYFGILLSFNSTLALIQNDKLQLVKYKQIEPDLYNTLY
jgi:hypothetical protein